LSVDGFRIITIALGQSVAVLADLAQASQPNARKAAMLQPETRWLKPMWCDCPWSAS